MEIFKNRKIAAIITAIIIIVSIFIGAQRSLGRLSDKVSDMFYKGVYIEDDDYTSASIYSALSNRVDYSLGLATIAANYDELSKETEALLAARNSLIDAQDSGNISAMYDANSALETAFITLWAKFTDTADISESDNSDAEDYVDSLSGAQSSIEGNKYNDELSELENDVLKAFPANLLMNIVSVELPEHFGQ